MTLAIASSSGEILQTRNNQAATRIQSFFRGRKVRNAQNETEAAATKIQAVFRAWASEQKVEEDLCSICLSRLLKGSRANIKGSKEDCRHIFHRACIQEWISQQNKCPLCKTFNPFPSLNKRLALPPGFLEQLQRWPEGLPRLNLDDLNDEERRFIEGRRILIEPFEGNQLDRAEVELINNRRNAPPPPPPRDLIENHRAIQACSVLAALIEGTPISPFYSFVLGLVVLSSFKMGNLSGALGSLVAVSGLSAGQSVLTQVFNCISTWNQTGYSGEFLYAVTAMGVGFVLALAQILETQKQWTERNYKDSVALVLTSLAAGSFVLPYCAGQYSEGSPFLMNSPIIGITLGAVVGVVLNQIRELAKD